MPKIYVYSDFLVSYYYGYVLPLSEGEEPLLLNDRISISKRVEDESGGTKIAFHRATNSAFDDVESILLDFLKEGGEEEDDEFLHLAQHVIDGVYGTLSSALCGDPSAFIEMPSDEGYLLSLEDRGDYLIASKEDKSSASKKFSPQDYNHLEDTEIGSKIHQALIGFVFRPEGSSLHCEVYAWDHSKFCLIGRTYVEHRPEPWCVYRLLAQFGLNGVLVDEIGQILGQDWYHALAANQHPAQL